MEMKTPQPSSRDEQADMELHLELQKVLEYARVHDLLGDLDMDPLSELAHPSNLVQRTIPMTNANGLTREDHLTKLLIPGVVATNIPWTVSSAPLARLQGICRTISDDELENLAKQVCQLGRAKALKLELPALRSDHGFDCRRMRANIAAARKVSLADHRLPLEPTDVEKDEGLDFPSAAWRCGEVFMQQIEKETVDVPKDAFRYLTEQLKKDFSEERRWELLHSQISYTQYSLDRLTPPIVSDLQSSDYFIPTPAACEVPIPSDPSSPLSDELRDVEEVLFDQAKDNSTPTPSSPSSLIAALDSPADELLLSWPENRIRPDGLKIDLPLLCNETVDENVPARLVDMGQLSKSVPHSDVAVPSDATEAIEPAMETELKAAETRVMRSIEQEHLDPKDARERVPVPVMDFSIPEAEWIRLGSDASAMFKYVQEGNSSAFNIPKWPRNRHVEEKMRWLPLGTGTGRISTDEELDIDENILEKFLALPSDSEMTVIADCVWKRTGRLTPPRNESEDEEDVQPICAEARSEIDLMAAVRAKKSLIANSTKSQSTIPQLQATLERFRKLSRKRCSEDPHYNTQILASDDSTAATTLLENFMNLHSQKKPKFIRSPFFTKCDGDAIETANQAHHPKLPEDAPAKPLIVSPSASCPTVKAPSAPIKLLMSMHLQAGVVRGLEQLIPGLSVVKRDYTAHNTSVWHPRSVCRSEVIPALADEVDVTISPITGLLITTLTKVRQKPIPGADGRSMLRARIQKVSLRYERLVILVSEGNKDNTMAEMSPSAATAFGELQGFIENLDTSTSMFYIAGGEEALAAWVASLICRHSHEALAVQHFLYAGETYWELFLRQAGLNVYAAQVVLGILKPPNDSIEAARSGKYGLPSFIKMSAEERVARFGSALGGRRVVDRVSQIIDASWE